MKQFLIVILIMLCSGCSLRGPFSQFDYDLDTYKYGVEFKSEYFFLRLGTQTWRKKKVEAVYNIGDEVDE